MKIVKTGLVVVGLIGFAFLGINICTANASFAENSAKADRFVASANETCNKWIEQAQRNVDSYLSQDGYQFEYILNSLNNARDLAKDELKYTFIPKNVREEETKKINAKVNAAFQAILVQCENKLVGEIAGVAAPKDTYKGKDKSTFKQAILKAWKTAYPDDEILDVRFPEAKWEREVKKQWEGDAWVKVDRSTLYARVIVKITPKLAIIYYAFINKNNLSKTWDTGVYTKQGYVSKLMLASNFK
jgi:hypothetical protein